MMLMLNTFLLMNKIILIPFSENAIDITALVCPVSDKNFCIFFYEIEELLIIILFI